MVHRGAADLTLPGGWRVALPRFCDCCYWLSPACHPSDNLLTEPAVQYIYIFILSLPCVALCLVMPFKICAAHCCHSSTPVLAALTSNTWTSAVSFPIISRKVLPRLHAAPEPLLWLLIHPQ